MFYNASPRIFENAKLLRENMTASEKILWDRLKCKQLLGLRFKPQHPIDIFIADFYCHQVKLVIEVDGGYHKNKDQREYDIGRESDLDKWGIKVIRFYNEDIENDIDRVLKEIEKTCINLKPELSQSPL